MNKKLAEEVVEKLMSLDKETLQKILINTFQLIDDEQLTALSALINLISKIDDILKTEKKYKIVFTYETDDINEFAKHFICPRDFKRLTGKPNYKITVGYYKKEKNIWGCELKDICYSDLEFYKDLLYGLHIFDYYIVEED